jgi:fatty acid amide hydrolase 2
LFCQVVAGPNQDRLSIAVAEELQRLMGGWIPPVPLATRASS